MTDTEALWYIDTIDKVKKMKLFYPHEQFADGTIRIKPFIQYALLETKRMDMQKLLSNFSVGHVTIYDKTTKYKTYYIFPLSGLKGEELQCFTICLKEFSIRHIIALEIKPEQQIETKYTSLSKKVDKQRNKTGKKPYQILISLLKRQNLADYITVVKPRNKKVIVSLPFPVDEAEKRTHRAFLNQFEEVKTPYQFYAYVLIPYHLIYKAQILFIDKSITTQKVKVTTEYVKSLLPKSRNLSLQNFIKLVNTTGFVQCEKFDKKHLMFEFTKDFLTEFKQCRIINTDLTFIIQGAPFAGNNLGSTPESIRALLLFLSALQSRKFLKISMSNFLELTEFSAKSRNVVSSINRVLEYLYESEFLQYSVKISKADIKGNNILKIKLK